MFWFFIDGGGVNRSGNRQNQSSIGRESVWGGLTASGKYLTAPDRFPRADWQHKFLVTGLNPLNNCLNINLCNNADTVWQWLSYEKKVITFWPNTFNTPRTYWYRTQRCRQFECLSIFTTNHNDILKTQTAICVDTTWELFGSSGSKCYSKPILCFSGEIKEDRCVIESNFVSSGLLIG